VPVASTPLARRDWDFSPSVSSTTPSSATPSSTPVWSTPFSY
jgi:hypothetical protein